MRIGEAELYQLAPLIDRRGRHRRGTGEVAQFDHDARIGDEFLGDGDGLARIVLAVLEDIVQRAAVGAARGVDLVQRQIEALLPLCPILRVGTGHGAADADQDWFRRRLGLGLMRSGDAQRDKRRKGKALGKAVDCAAYAVLVINGHFDGLLLKLILAKYLGIFFDCSGIFTST